MCNDSIVPNYLKNIAYEVIQKKEKVSFKTECTCGCRLFDFYKKKKSNEDKSKETTLKTLDEKYNGKFYSDSDGNLWLCSKSFLGINRKKIKDHETRAQVIILLYACHYKDLLCELWKRVYHIR